LIVAAHALYVAKTYDFNIAAVLCGRKGKRKDDGMKWVGSFNGRPLR
jgi:hypothetical protein